MSYRFIYGPVPSRRLGRSLGISPIPDKTCNYSCIYCMLGRTDHFSNERRRFYSTQDILTELGDVLPHVVPAPDYLSIVGNGEPTLYLHLDELIDGVHSLSDIPVAVFTNGALLSDPAVRAALDRAELVFASFNASDDRLFRRINRPCPGITYETARQGLVDFARTRRHSRLWVSMMLMEGINDSPDVLEEVRRTLEEVRPDRVFVDTPVRPPAESFVHPVSPQALTQAQAILGACASGSEMGSFPLSPGEDPVETLAEVCMRHPMRADQIEEVLATAGIDPLPVLARLRADTRFIVEEYGGQVFFLARERGGSVP